MHVRGECGVQRSDVAAVPCAEYVLGQADMAVVALGVYLLAEKMDQPVLPAGQLIDHRADVAQLPFRPDLVEIHREEYGELLYQEMQRANVRVEQRRDIPLEKVVVRYEHAAEAEVNDERGEQPRAAPGIVFDQGEPGADVLHMVLFDLRLPFLVHTAQFRVHEAEIDDRVDEAVDQDRIVRRQNHLAQRLQAFQHGVHMHRAHGMQNAEHVVEEYRHFLAPVLFVNAAQCAVQIPEQVFVQMRESGQGQDGGDVVRSPHRRGKQIAALAEALGDIAVVGNVLQLLPGFGRIEPTAQRVEPCPPQESAQRIGLLAEQCRMRVDDAFDMRALAPGVNRGGEGVLEQCGGTCAGYIRRCRCAKDRTLHAAGKHAEVMIRIQLLLDGAERHLQHRPMCRHMLRRGAMLGKFQQGLQYAPAVADGRRAFKQFCHDADEDGEMRLRGVEGFVEPEVLQRDAAQLCAQPGDVGVAVMILFEERAQAFGHAVLRGRCVEKCCVGSGQIAALRTGSFEIHPER